MATKKQRTPKLKVLVGGLKQKTCSHRGKLTLPLGCAVCLVMARAGRSLKLFRPYLVWDADQVSR
jgi:hypothetical protein